MAYIALKDHFRETKLFNNRSIIAFVCVVLALVGLLSRLVYLQVLSHEHYAALSNNNRVSVVPIAPTRGLIFDRNGVILAQNLPTFSLEIVPERTEDLEQTLTTLQNIIDISASDITRFRKRLKHKRRFHPTVLRFRLSDEEAARIAINRHRLPGVEVAAHLIRDYPLANLTVHAIGYVGRINSQELKVIDQSNYAATSHIGKLGVEKAYETTLHGRVGSQRVETNVLGRVIRVLENTPPTVGTNLVLTLDTQLQKIAKDALGEEKGAVVAIDPRNGEVLVLASQGDYDPNLFVNGIDYATYDALKNSRSKPLFNRAIKGQYPPGSTIKPFIGLAALELRQTSPGKAIYCPGWYTLPGHQHKYRDWKKTGHGRSNLRQAIIESCDVYYYDLARFMGINRIHDYLAPFGFGRRTGIDISGEVSGILPSTAWKKRARGKPWYLGETLIAGIGQGYSLATPLQLANATATLANRGQPVHPHLLNDTQHSNMNPDITTPEKIKIIEPRNWEYIVKAMVDVIYSPKGTAKKLNKNQPYKIAGKTGTAQVFGIKQDEEYIEEDIQKHLRDHALFIAFAPANNPKIAIAVVVENGGSGGSVAGPVAGAIIDRYLALENEQ